MVKFLVEKGARLTHTSIKNRWNPVYIAACLGTLESLEYLLSFGLDPNQETGLKRTALTKACWLGRTDSVEVLLRHPNIKIDHKANGDRTALHMACWGKYGGRFGKKMGTNSTDSPECAELLLAAGANPNSRDDKGKTPLMVACQTGGKRCIPILIDYGADINAVSMIGATALHTSFYFGTLGTVKALLWHKYKEGQTPQRIDVSTRLGTMRDGTVVKYEMIESPTRRDCHNIWRYVIQEEAKLLENGYQGITIGSHNFDRLLGIALGNKAFKCLVVLMEYYEERLRGQDLGIDLVKILALGLTVFKAPVKIISKLYRFVRP